MHTPSAQRAHGKHYSRSHRKSLGPSYARLREEAMTTTTITTRFGAAALRSEVERIRTRKCSLERRVSIAAENMGQLVAGGELDLHETVVALVTIAEDEGMSSHDAHVTVNLGLDRGMEN